MRKVALITVVLLLAIAVVPAAARGKPQDVTIEVIGLFSSPINAFTAEGPAVDADLICESGITETKFWAFHPPPDPEPSFNTASNIKKFTCDDETDGIFYVKLEIRFTDTGTVANWVVVDWAEDPSEFDLEELRGQGKLVFVRNAAGTGGIDTYTGQLH